MKTNVFGKTISTAFRDDIQRLNRYRYNEDANPNGIDNLPHAINVLGASFKGQRYIEQNQIDTMVLESAIAKHLNVSEEDLRAYRNDPITLQSNVYHLGVSTRIFNALQRSGYSIIDSALNLTYEDARQIRNLGEDSLHEFVLSLKEWADRMDTDIADRPLIQTTPDAELRLIGPKEVTEYLDTSFDVILNTKEYLSIDVLDAPQYIISALKKNKVYSLKALAKKPISTWLGLRGIGMGAIIPLVLAMEAYEERLSNTKTYIADINIQASICLNGVNKDEIYTQVIEQLRHTLDNTHLNIDITEKEK